MEDDDRRTLVERVVDATNEKVTRVQNEVNPVVSATRDRANAVRTMVVFPTWRGPATMVMKRGESSRWSWCSPTR